MKFESQRLKCRYFTELDYELFSSIFSNEQVMKYAWIDKIENEEEMRGFFKGFLNQDDRINSNNSYAYAVFLRDSVN